MLNLSFCVFRCKRFQTGVIVFASFHKRNMFVRKEKEIKRQPAAFIKGVFIDDVFVLLCVLVGDGRRLIHDLRTFMIQLCFYIYMIISQFFFFGFTRSWCRCAGRAWRTGTERK